MMSWRNCTQRKLVGFLTAGAVIAAPALVTPGCGGDGFLGLEDYERDILFEIGSLALFLLAEQRPDLFPPLGEPQPGEPVPGRDGLNCWDLNGNGVPEPKEDTNHDGSFTALDCQGAPGAAGDDGAAGQAGSEGGQGPAGPSGAPGPAGPPGRACWDVNGNLVPDAKEDVNGDGTVDVFDCRGTDGHGADGVNCWDLNQNGIRDVDTEDADGNGVVDVGDCRGADGEDGVDGADGEDGADGTDGRDGVNCWDLDGDGFGNLATEDFNGDGAVDVLDCRGAPGEDGVDGTDGEPGPAGPEGPQGPTGAMGPTGPQGPAGTTGPTGPAGLSCWDIDGDRFPDPDEDTNGDGQYTTQDCQGSAVVEIGPAAMFFDLFVDDFFTVGSGVYDTVPFGAGLEVNSIEEPSLGPAKVIAYRTVVPYTFSEDVQNTVVMRLFFWREGPVDDCFVVRLDAFRTGHGLGALRYGSERYLKLDDPPFPNPLGTTVVIDLPFNNGDGDPADGLCLPADLRVGEFLAFELNIVPHTANAPEVSYTLLGVEFFETTPGSAIVEHATVFKTAADVDCPFVAACRNDNDCDDGLFCNGAEVCDESGVCQPGSPPCLPDKACDEVEDGCVGCEVPVSDHKSALCHLAGRDPERRHTIIVADPAVPSHLAHGDTLGPCPEDCPEGP